jgi:ATP-binding cassette subfamily C (CFTR/MRP) protein 4
MQAAYQMFIMQFITLIVGTVNSQIALYIMLMSYIWLGNSITSELVYFVFVIFMNVSLTVSVMFPMALSQAAQLVPTVKRIGAILKKIEIQTEEPPIGRSGVKVSLDDVTVSIGEKPVLQKCNLDLGKGLTILTGPVGSGKTILLKTVLQEYEPVEGKLTVQGDVSYASQEPWLFPSSIKQNILFGQKYDEARYRNVLKICALVYDLDHLECGDSTIVEDRGSNLSRGQQARINLARAIYKDSDIYLLDDCLAGLDGHVSSSIFENCIKTFLKEKLVILVTHNDNYVKEADVRIFLKSGTVESGEKFERLDKEELHSERYETEEDLDENDQVVDESSKLIPETVTRRRVYQEDKKSGEVVARVYKKYFSSGGGFIGVMSVLLVHVLVQFVLSWKEKFLSDW